MIPLPVVLLALYLACSTALGVGLVGAAAFLGWVAEPLARRLPEEQARLLSGRAVSWLRLMAGLVTVDSLIRGLPSLLPEPEFSWILALNWAAAILLPLAVLVLAGPGVWRARLACLGVALYVALCLVPAPGEGFSLINLCVALAVVGLGLCLGSLPPLWRLLGAPWPASVAQAVGARHFALILPGLALLAACLALAWPHRGIFLDEHALPITLRTAGIGVLALLAAAARGGMLFLASRPARAAGWLAPLRAVVEVELILGLLLSALLIPLALFPLARHESWLPEALYAFAFPISGYAGGLLLAMALLAGWHATGGPARARYWPALLLPLAGVVLWGMEGEMGQALTVLLVIAALTEVGRLFLGASPRLVLAPALLGVPALVLLMISIPESHAGPAVNIAVLTLIARWLELRLPPSAAARLAGLLHAVLLGALGLLLLLPHVR